MRNPNECVPRLQRGPVAFDQSQSDPLPILLCRRYNLTNYRTPIVREMTGVSASFCKDLDSVE